MPWKVLLRQEACNKFERRMTMNYFELYQYEKENINMHWLNPLCEKCL